MQQINQPHQVARNQEVSDWEALSHFDPGRVKSGAMMYRWHHKVHVLLNGSF